MRGVCLRNFKRYLKWSFMRDAKGRLQGSMEKNFFQMDGARTLQYYFCRAFVGVQSKNQGAVRFNFLDCFVEALREHDSKFGNGQIGEYPISRSSKPSQYFNPHS